MQTAYFHRAYWDYERQLGIAKIHQEDLGVFAFVFENFSPKVNVNFQDKTQFTYYWQQYKAHGATLRLGVQIDRDVEIIKVTKKENIFQFPTINLEVKLENNIRYFRSIGGDWQEFEDDMFVEYQPCKSLIDVR
nr:hypothetical protein [Nostoc sp. EkiNYC01]